MVHQQYNLQLRDLLQAAWQERRAEDGGFACRPPKHRPALHLCRARCVWPLVCHFAKNTWRSSEQQAVNPPHSSHMGGSWEQLIGVTRRIPDAMLLKLGTAKLTHEVPTTLMAEVTAIVNTRPVTSVSTDSENPVILTPATLLTQKVGTHPLPPGQFDDSDLFRRQWRQVQSLANTFWERWKREYIGDLQRRRIWRNERPNMQEGVVVLLRDNQVKRNH